jgi:DNA-binding CsgD family transcriptional regulator
MIADLDTLLTALYVELTDRIIPALGLTRRGPGKPREVTDAELVCLAVAQVLLRFDDERRWLRAAPRLVGALFPRLLRQSDRRVRQAGRSALGALAAAQRARLAPGPDQALTATERRIAGLVAAGQTNPEIAAALYISVKTVEANLTRIYRKLGLRGRVDLARHSPS